MNIVFAHPRYVHPVTKRPYDSYVDYRKLVELGGFETCYVDEVDVSKHVVYITCPYNGEWKPHIENQTGKPRNAYLIHWCLERPSGSGGPGRFAKSNREKLYNREFDEVWISDRRLADESMFRHVVCGSDYGLGEPGNVGDKKYLMTHMSYITNRRQRVYGEFELMDIGPNRWPWDANPSRDEVLKRSKFALNIHQDDYPFMEPLRWALFAAYGLPMLTESVFDAWPWNESICRFHDYDGICGFLRQMLGNDYNRWYDVGMRARDFICGEWNFRKTVIKAVRESLKYG